MKQAKREDRTISQNQSVDERFQPTNKKERSEERRTDTYKSPALQGPPDVLTTPMIANSSLLVSFLFFDPSSTKAKGSKDDPLVAVSF